MLVWMYRIIPEGTERAIIVRLRKEVIYFVLFGTLPCRVLRSFRRKSRSRGCMTFLRLMLPCALVCCYSLVRLFFRAIGPFLTTDCCRRCSLCANKDEVCSFSDFARLPPSFRPSSGVSVSPAQLLIRRVILFLFYPPLAPGIS